MRPFCILFYVFFFFFCLPKDRKTLPNFGGFFATPKNRNVTFYMCWVISSTFSGLHKTFTTYLFVDALELWMNNHVSGGKYEMNTYTVENRSCPARRYFLLWEQNLLGKFARKICQVLCCQIIATFFERLDYIWLVHLSPISFKPVTYFPHCAEIHIDVRFFRVFLFWNVKPFAAYI